MNISYNWLKEYVDFNLTPDEVAAALTSIGLETGGVEEVQTIKGGLEGLVIGEVLTCVPHPNSDHMHVTTVNLGSGEPEDEIGIGTDHAGIIVLPADVVPGTLAKDYYQVKSDYVLEVDITPNRADACSHYGVARDLYAWLIQNGHSATLKRPSVDAFAVENHDLDINVTVENA